MMDSPQAPVDEAHNDLELKFFGLSFFCQHNSKKYLEASVGELLKPLLEN